MKYTCSLKKNHEFRRLYSKGRSLSGPVVVVYYRRNKLGVNRLGITVSKKLGGAVKRNKVRRRIREAYRINEHLFSPGWDIVIVARVRAATSTFSEIQSNILRSARKAGLIEVIK